MFLSRETVRDIVARHRSLITPKIKSSGTHGNLTIGWRMTEFPVWRNVHLWKVSVGKEKLHCSLLVKVSENRVRSEKTVYRSLRTYISTLSHIAYDIAFENSILLFNDKQISHAFQMSVPRVFFAALNPLFTGRT